MSDSTTECGEAAGVDADDAARATAAATMFSLTTLFALPTLTLASLLAGVRIPDTLIWVAVSGAVAFAALFAAGAVLLFANAPFEVVATRVTRVARHFGKRVTPRNVRHQRDDMRRLLGRRWHAALASSLGTWLFDFLSLALVPFGLGAEPRLSLVLLAFTAAKILGMVPITPGGLGIVEAGLSGLLALIGVPFATAIIATLGYRIVSYWLSIPVGVVAWLLFNSRHSLTRRAATTRR